MIRNLLQDGTPLQGINRVTLGRTLNGEQVSNGKTKDHDKEESDSSEEDGIDGIIKFTNEKRKKYKGTKKRKKLIKKIRKKFIEHWEDDRKTKILQ